jgi:hypothetical protein
MGGVGGGRSVSMGAAPWLQSVSIPRPPSDQRPGTGYRCTVSRSAVASPEQAARVARVERHGARAARLPKRPSQMRRLDRTTLASGRHALTGLLDEVANKHLGNGGLRVRARRAPGR